MKKAFVLFLIITCVTKSYTQDAMLPKVIGDTLFTTSGYKIIVGQEINIGTGATPDGDFKFIRRNSSGLGAMLIMTDNNSYNKSELSLQRNASGHKGKVVKIVSRGNKKNGIVYEPIINFGAARFEIDADNAIASGEIIVPNEFKPQPKTLEGKQPVSIADELAKLKKLLDDGVLTKEEYDTQKKKLLGN